MTVRGGGRPRAAAWLSCRTTEWVRRLGASLTDAHPCIMVTDLDGPPNTSMRREVFDAAEAGSPRHRHADHRQRAVVLGVVKVWPGNVDARGTAAVTANLDSPCARRLTRHVGRGGETGFQAEQRNCDEVEKESGASLEISA